MKKDSKKDDSTKELKETKRLQINVQEDLHVAREVEETAQHVRQIKVNILVNSIVWLFTYTAFTGLQDIQSSLNSNLGTYTMGALTAGTFTICLVSPAIINRLGCKGSMTLSWFCQCLFIGANFYPKAYLLLPVAFIEGLATGLVWNAQGVYVTTLAAHFASLTGKNLDSILSTFFGIFFMAFQSTQVWGNIISSAVLKYSDDDHAYTISNSSKLRETEDCGSQFCPSSSIPTDFQTNSKELDKTLRYNLLGIFMAFAVIGLIINIVCLQPIKERDGAPRLTATVLLLSTIRLLKTSLHMILLIPLFLYIGVEQGLIFAEFTKVYVTCTIGIGWVGYTMLCYGICDTIMSPVAGILGKYLKRSVLITWAMLLNLVILVVMLLWKPLPTDQYVFFIVPGVWGLADAVWQTQSSALIGVVFFDDQEAAFANLRLFVSLGKTMAYLYSGLLCENVKLYIACCLLVIAVVLSTIVEILIHNKQRPGYNNIDS